MPGSCARALCCLCRCALPPAHAKPQALLCAGLWAAVCALLTTHPPLARAPHAHLLTCICPRTGGRVCASASVRLQQRQLFCLASPPADTSLSPCHPPWLCALFDPAASTPACLDAIGPGSWLGTKSLGLHTLAPLSCTCAERSRYAPLLWPPFLVSLLSQPLPTAAASVFPQPASTAPCNPSVTQLSALPSSG